MAGDDASNEIPVVIEYVEDPARAQSFITWLIEQAELHPAKKLARKEDQE